MKNIASKILRPKNINALMLLLVIIMMSAMGAHADNQGFGLNATNNQEGGQHTMPMADVSIKQKTLEAVITNIGDRYTLSKETIIVDMNGQQVSIREMLVPCEAQVTYNISKDKRIAQRIKIVRRHNDARWQWTADKPE